MEEQNQHADNQNGYRPLPDEPNLVFNIISCCIPLVGLILYIVWKDIKPVSAKKAGYFALAGLMAAVLFYIVIIAIGVVIAVIA